MQLQVHHILPPKRSAQLLKIQPIDIRFTTEFGYNAVDNIMLQQPLFDPLSDTQHDKLCEILSIAPKDRHPNQVSQIYNIISKLPYLRSLIVEGDPLLPQDLLFLSRQATLQKYNKGEIISQAGTKALKLNIILSGKVVVTQDIGKRPEKHQVFITEPELTIEPKAVITQSKQVVEAQEVLSNMKQQTRETGSKHELGQVIQNINQVTQSEKAFQLKLQTLKDRLRNREIIIEVASDSTSSQDAAEAFSGNMDESILSVDLAKVFESDRIPIQSDPILFLTAGYVFGMLAFESTTQNRVANVYARRKTIVMQVSKQAVQKMIQNKTRRKTQFNTQFLSSLQQFSGFKTEKLKKLVSMSKIIKRTINAVIIKQGDPCKYFYVIIEGQFQVQTKMNAQVLKLGLKSDNQTIGDHDCILKHAVYSHTVHQISQSSQLLQIAKDDLLTLEAETQWAFLVQHCEERMAFDNEQVQTMIRNREEVEKKLKPEIDIESIVLSKIGLRMTKHSNTPTAKISLPSIKKLNNGINTSNTHQSIYQNTYQTAKKDSKATQLLQRPRSETNVFRQFSSKYNVYKEHNKQKTMELNLNLNYLI